MPIFFKGILKEAIQKSKLPATCKRFSEVPEDCVFGRFMCSLKVHVKAGCLCKKVKHWFDHTQGSGPDLLYRFTVEESRRFCHNYMSLVNALIDGNDTKADRQAILVFAYLGQRLRDSVSLMNGFDINEEQLTQLTLAAQEYLRVNAMFLTTSVNPTVWTLEHIVPVHAQQVFAQYNKGLALVTMEG